MKIMHVVEAWNGGIGRYVDMLIDAHAGDHDLVVLYDHALATRGFNGEAYRARGVKIIPYDSSRNPARLYMVARQVQRLITQECPDIVHLHSSFPGVYGRMLRARSQDIGAQVTKIVYCAHGWSFAQDSSAVKRMIYGVFERILARRCDGIIHISEHEAEHAARIGIDHISSMSVPMRVILNGASAVSVHDPVVCVPSTTKARLHLGFVGRLSHKKGFDILRDYMRDHAPDDVHLTVIGAHDDDAQSVPKDTPNITYLGWIEADGLDGYYQQFDLLIVPSRHEGFGLVVIEAMRNGVPVIVARDTAMPELIREGSTGLSISLSTFTQEMSDILTSVDRVQLAEMGRNARIDFNAHFTAKRMSNEIMDFYMDLYTAR